MGNSIPEEVGNIKTELTVALIELINMHLEEDEIWDVAPSIPLQVMNKEHFNVNKNRSHMCIASKYLLEFKPEEIKRIENRPVYDYAYWQLTETKSDLAIAFAKKVCELIDREEWDKAFKESSYLIEIAITNGVDFYRHHFSEAFEEFVVYQITIECNADEWMWDNFNAIFSKIQERKKAAIRISKAYLSNPNDVITPKAFGAIKKLETSKMNIVLEGNTLKKISLWLDRQESEKIRWLLDKHNLVPAEIDFPEEGFVTRLKKAYENKEDKCHSCVKELSKLLGINLESDESDNKTNSSKEMKK